MPQNKPHRGKKEDFMTTVQRQRFFKPTIKAQSGGLAYFKGWKEWEAGNYVIGEYISSFETSFKGQTSTNYRIKVLECDFVVTKDGQDLDPTGEILVLNGNGKLNKFMTDVKAGMLVEVAYGGKQPGIDGTLYHTFDRLEAGYSEEKSSDLGELNDL